MSGLFESSLTRVMPRAFRSRPEREVAVICFKSQPLVGFHRIQAFVLQSVGLKLCHQADTAAFLLFIDQNPGALLGDQRAKVRVAGGNRSVVNEKRLR